MSKTKYKVGTHVGYEYCWAMSPRQALWLVWRRLKGYGGRTLWSQAEAGWSVETVDS